MQKWRRGRRSILTNEWERIGDPVEMLKMLALGSRPEVARVLPLREIDEMTFPATAVPMHIAKQVLS